MADCEMDDICLVDMHGGKVISSMNYTGPLWVGEQGWLSSETFDCSNVVSSFVLGQFSPGHQVLISHHSI